MKKKRSFTSLVTALAAIAAFGLVQFFNDGTFSLTSIDNGGAAIETIDIDNKHLREVIANERSGTMVSGQGRVIKVLADDVEGSAHQRFIIELPSGETLLIAHNIDLAPRLPNLTEQAQIVFKGQYEANDRGGVIHWTHDDPQGQHEEGFLEYQGKRYH